MILLIGICVCVCLICIKAKRKKERKLCEYYAKIRKCEDEHRKNVYGLEQSSKDNQTVLAHIDDLEIEIDP